LRRQLLGREPASIGLGGGLARLREPLLGGLGLGGEPAAIGRGRPGARITRTPRRGLGGLALLHRARDRLARRFLARLCGGQRRARLVLERLRRERLLFERGELALRLA